MLGVPIVPPPGLDQHTAPGSHPQSGAVNAPFHPPNVPDFSVPEEVMENAEQRPSVSEEALARDMQAFGWCRVEEVPPDE